MVPQRLWQVKTVIVHYAETGAKDPNNQRCSGLGLWLSRGYVRNETRVVACQERLKQIV